MKGISPFVSHAIAFVLAILFFAIVTTFFYSYYTSVMQAKAAAEGSEVARLIGRAVLDLHSRYSTSDYLPTTEASLGSIELNVPAKIAGTSYFILLNTSGDFWIEAEIEVGGKETETEKEERPVAGVVIKTLGWPRIEVKYPLYNLEINISGEVRKTDKILLTYIRLNKEGEAEDRIELTRA